MGLAADLERIAAAALAYGDGRELSGVLATEALPGARVYVCAFETDDAERAWIALDDVGEPVGERRDVRDAVSIAALCEVAEEAAFPGDLDELRAQLVALRIAEAPEGIAEAEEAARALQHVLGAPPHLASPERLDAIGEAARRLERALDPTAPSPFTDVLRSAGEVADALWRDVEAGYLRPLDRITSLGAMEGGGFFPFGGDPEEIMRGLREFAEQQAEGVKEAQREQFATLTLSTAVDLTQAALAQIAPTGSVDEQALQLRDAMRVLFPEAVALVSAARQGFMRE